MLRVTYYIVSLEHPSFCRLVSCIPRLLNLRVFQPVTITRERKSRKVSQKIYCVAVCSSVLQCVLQCMMQCVLQYVLDRHGSFPSDSVHLTNPLVSCTTWLLYIRVFQPVTSRERESGKCFNKFLPQRIYFGTRETVLALNSLPLARN